MSKTSIIVSNLAASAFTANAVKGMTVPDYLKTRVLQEFTNTEIEYWSNLPFLNRIVIILRTEPTATMVREFVADVLRELSIEARITQQENLLRRHKLIDNLNLGDFNQWEEENSASLDYKEPEPHHSPELPPIDLTEVALLKPIETTTDYGPTPGPKRTRSLTRTLYSPPPALRPDLSLDIPSDRSHSPQKSPTITLDEL